MQKTSFLLDAVIFGKNYFEREARLHVRVGNFAEGDPDTCLQNNNTVT